MKLITNIKNPNRLLWLFLAAWWIINIIQAAFTELANDEAYYRMFAENLSWGYFDHPPMVALLIWMGNFIGGELGVRLFVTMLQPVYLYALWMIIRPAKPDKEDVSLFILIAAAIPILQLYGFIATPDAPLMFFTGLFLLCYKKFTEQNSWKYALLMGLTIGALAYSKYHGALVVAITVLSNLKLLKNPKFYFSCIIALLMITPHLWWQYQHDWASFRYHLVSRGRDFEWSFVTEYILNVFAVFNPFLFPIFVKGWWKAHAKEPVLRALNAISVGFILFFLASTTKGYAQPQWIIPATFGIIAILFQYTRNRGGMLRNYTVKIAWITIALVALVRIEMIFNPLGLKFEIFDNKTSNAQLAEIAAGRPIIFDGSYTGASKYSFYTGGKAYAQPSINNRTSQYELKNDDDSYAGQPVIMEFYGQSDSSRTLELANGKIFKYIENKCFIPVRKIEVDITPSMPTEVQRGESLKMKISIRNPYPYSYNIDGIITRIGMVWDRRGEAPRVVPLNIKGVLKPGGSLEAEVSTEVPYDLNLKEYRTGITIANTAAASWFNSKITNVKITE